MFGLKDKDLSIIKDVLNSFPEIEKASIFGSRALGNYKTGSDVDIVLFGSNLNLDIIRKISQILNQEKPLPYFFDILNYNDISNKNLIAHINEKAIKFYEH